MARGEAAGYIRNNKEKVRYSRTPITDLEERENRDIQRTYPKQAKGKQFRNTLTGAMIKNIRNNPITISRDHYGIVQIGNYINTARKEEQQYETKED